MKPDANPELPFPEESAIVLGQNEDRLIDPVGFDPPEKSKRRPRKTAKKGQVDQQ